jgi:hypothetical protein
MYNSAKRVFYYIEVSCTVFLIYICNSCSTAACWPADSDIMMGNLSCRTLKASHFSDLEYYMFLSLTNPILFSAIYNQPVSPLVRHSYACHRYNIRFTQFNHYTTIILTQAPIKRH